ncbi:hypothetical protein IC235_09215 [Hymenobacter sp. BT664]|uniref:DUF4129 domain-containing protein n=1 Tax=Hymenobacter montanus TaxID=2771359 RepID=A0A927GJ33_9BACT|nr:hypothetical protein [Hymenobacter montanus]MBD2768068.1 hypothetical protein [Hymenobacter montanus]
MVKQIFFALLLLLAPLAHAETPAEANKRLFDKTIDELNFRTMETVYDKSFARGKFPLTLRTAAARRSFDGFDNNATLKRLFMNYNDAAERYKNRYGNGPNTLAEFQKQLNSVLLDKNFEFFIHNLPRDERVALVRAEQRLIQQATAQFNASGASEDAAAVPPADVDAQPEAPVAAPLTTHDEGSASAADAAEEPSLTSQPAASGPAPRHDWLDYFTLLLSLTSVLLLLYLTTSVLPVLSRRINNLAAEPEPEPEPRSLISRLRATRSPGLHEDRYEEDNDDPDHATGPHR